MSYYVTHNSSVKSSKFQSLTYFGSISSQLAKFFKKYNLNIAFKTTNTLYNKLVNIKDKREPLTQSGVYSLNCEDCNAVYVGQSGRKIITRVREHLSEFNKHKNTEITETKSAFASHLLTSGHSSSIPENVKILHECPKGKKLDLLEKLEISKAKKSPILSCVNDVFTFEPHLVFNNLSHDPD